MKCLCRMEDFKDGAKAAHAYIKLKKKNLKKQKLPFHQSIAILAQFQAQYKSTYWTSSIKRNPYKL